MIGEETRPQHEYVNWKIVKRFLLSTALLFFLLFAFFSIFRSLLVPIGLSAVIAYLLNPAVNKFDRMPVPRSIVVLVLLILIFGILTIGFYEVIPYIYTELLNLLNRAPKALVVIQNWVPEWESRLVEFGIIEPGQLTKSLSDIQFMGHIADQLRETLNTLWRNAPKVFGTVVNVVLTPLLSFFLLKDLPRLKVLWFSLVPLDLRDPYKKFGHHIDLTLRSVFKGQVIIASTLAVLYVLGFNLIGLSSATAIGIVAGVCRVVPYLDILIGGGLGLLVIISSSAGIGMVGLLFLVFLIVQTVDGLAITPRVVGSKVGVHPIIVIMSILAFSDMFGFIGVLIAIPVVALAKMIWHLTLPYYYASKLYDAENRGIIKKRPAGR